MILAASIVVCSFSLTLFHAPGLAERGRVMDEAIAALVHCGDHPDLTYDYSKGSWKVAAGKHTYTMEYLKLLPEGKKK
jgi:hypothetical protein